MAAQTPAEDMKEAQEIWNKLSLGEKIGVITLPFVALFLVGGVVYWLGYPWTCSQAQSAEESAEQELDAAVANPDIKHYELQSAGYDRNQAAQTTLNKCY
ncbi:hypothetical protein H6G00_05175 [Leptolyngbya sp. FACHB-541]|uniref:hypothetical protein n=1 Tax=Leptolyngbya sp. FACHB-541 TaxID=2692810 RepID=UPI001688FB18|nr:hypothetical protein [Leptolyngbya sp. FACHB-541]MBD1996008.1 hypothetical protein [Leptolyngbya sp. FACHB-541]